MAVRDQVRVDPGHVPSDYHCRCRYCSVPIGELRPDDGTYYSRLERRKYYDPIESAKGSGHIAKTPLHVARWAVQQFSIPGDWVLDPTIGAGTTAFEALTHGRNAAGMELEFHEVVLANARKALELAPCPVKFEFRRGDARNIRKFLDDVGVKFSLVVNNPPYFGDVSFPSPAKEGRGKEFRDKERRYDYDKSLPNLAFLKEGAEYWQTMAEIYGACADRLAPGGHFVVGVKDQMRARKPDQLHEKLADVVAGVGLTYVGAAFLKHYPGTLHLNTYEKRYGVAPPSYQSIVVFKKGAP